MLPLHLFSTVEELPTDVEVPRIRGRILVAGTIRDTGFARKEVVSPCMIRTAQGALEPRVLGDTPQVTREQFQEAVGAASHAWNKGLGEWSTARMEERIVAIALFKKRFVEKRELLARLLIWEIAKTRADAFAEIDRTAQYIDDTLEAAKQLDREGARVQFAGGLLAQVRRMPLGVTLCMGPFNYPINETFTTLIPALLMGNTAVVKLPRFGQLVWDPLLEAFQECFPPGVVNIVNGLGREIIEPSVQSGLIDVLAFIGSSRVANGIKLAHPRPHHFRSILGLDAKNPALLLEDADLAVAIPEIIKGALSFNGQRCTAIKIVFAPESLRTRLCAELAAAVDALGCGMPWTPGATITPLADPQKPAQLARFVQDACARGARLLNPTRGAQHQQTLFAPAVVSDVPLDSSLGCEEQFGPVIPLVFYKDVSTFVNYMTDSSFGMQASLFGQDPARVGPLIDALSNQVCRINLNSQCQRGPDVFPFTGRKNSAEGTLSVTDALRSFSIRNLVTAKQDTNGKALFKGILQGDTSRFLSADIVL